MAKTTYEFVMQELDRSPFTLREISEKTDVPYSTLTRISRGGNGSVHVFDRLAAFFRSAQSRKAG